MIMKTSPSSCLAVALSLWSLGDNIVVNAQVTVDVSDCSSLPAAIAEDTVLQFTATPISCTTNTKVDVTTGATVAITSTQAATKLENIRFYIKEASTFLSSVPNLEWSSQEPKASVAGGALKVSKGCIATFQEDTTFSSCSIIDDYESPGGAVSNRGTLTFEKTATFVDTIEGGAVYNTGVLTFEGDALFENNKHFTRYNTIGVSSGDDSYTSFSLPTSSPSRRLQSSTAGNETTGDGGGADGGGLYNDMEGTVHFKAAATFVGNEVAELKQFEAEGVFFNGGRGAGVFTYGSGIVFSGPATFKGNKGKSGIAMYMFGEEPVVFESLVTFEDNIGESAGDSSEGGAMAINSYNSVEFQAGVVATGNAAKSGGAFYIRDNCNVTMTGPVTITGNAARYEGGAIWTEGSRLVLPSDADISGNTAILCPGIKIFDNNVYDPFAGGDSPQGTLEFTGGATTVGGSKELCYLGETTVPTSTQLDATSDCASVISGASFFGDYPYVVMDTREVSTWELTDFSCDTQLIVYITGGEELTISAAADTTTVENVSFEVIGYTKLTISAAEIIMTGIQRSEIAGTMFIERGSSMDVMSKIYFMENTLAYLTHDSWAERGGGAMYSAGKVTFHEKAYFLGNGQYEQEGFEQWNQPGGAIVSVGIMEFMKKATFKDNFALHGGNGGGIANGGTLTFNRKAIFRNNTAEVSFTDDGENYDGHGAGLYNLGGSATVLFKRLAIFKDNKGGYRGCALGANGGTEENGDIGEGLNSIVFEDKAEFMDNYCYRNETGGAALWVYGESTVEFQDTAVFKRNIARNGGAIMNAGTLKFASQDALVMADNVAKESCPDIKNYDKNLDDHLYDEFGDINDPNYECSPNTPCTWYLGEVQIGSDSYTGESADICELA